MKPTTKLLLTGAVCLAACFTTQAQTWLFDFGNVANPTGPNYNDLTGQAGATPALWSITNTIDDVGNPTSISITAKDWNFGVNDNGTTTPSGAAALFATTATSDNFFGHSTLFNMTNARPLGIITLSGLDSSGATSYSFTFFASRMGVGDNRETKYEPEGFNTDFGLLNASGNDANVAQATNIVPDALGNITLYVSAGPNNNNGNKFFYLGAMRMVTGGPVTGLPDFTNQPAHKTVSAGGNATFTADISNPAGATYQWQLGRDNLVDGGSVSGATTKTLTITGVSASDVGHYRLRVSNAQGNVYSAPASLQIVGLNFYPCVTITGKVGDANRIDYATALAPTTWIPLSTNILTTSPQVIPDATSPGSNTRFYRAVYLP